MATSLSFGDYSAESSGQGDVPYTDATMQPPMGQAGGYSSSYSSSYSGGAAGGSGGGGGQPPMNQGFADLGKMSTAAAAGAASNHMSSFSQSSFADEPPLLEELGIDFDHIRKTTIAVLNPTGQMDSHVMDGTDLAGPLLFCLAFGACLLAQGKVQFGYIYGVAGIGCFCLYGVLSAMTDSSLSLGRTTSILGYSLLPMVFLSGVSIMLSLKGTVGTFLAVASIAWCTHSSARMFVAALSMHGQYALVAYPCALVYGVFALLTIF